MIHRKPLKNRVKRENMRDTSAIRSRNNKIILISGIVILALSSISAFTGGKQEPIAIDLGDSIYDVANGLSGYEEQYSMGDDWLKLVCIPQSAWARTLKQKKVGYYEVGFTHNNVTSIAWYSFDHVLQKDGLLHIRCSVP